MRLKILLLIIKMNPLFKMASGGGGPTGATLGGIHSGGIHNVGNHHIGNQIGPMHGNGIGGQSLHQGIGGYAIGHNSNAPPRS
jgi:hypothetical protein